MAPASDSALQQFAFESLLVENGITISQFANVLFEFLGEHAVVTEARVRDLILSSGVASDLADTVIGRLRGVSFLGIETGDGRFEYPESGNAMERANVLSRKHRERTAGEVRYAIHPAFRAYLEIHEALPGRADGNGEVPDP